MYACLLSGGQAEGKPWWCILKNKFCMFEIQIFWWFGKNWNGQDTKVLHEQVFFSFLHIFCSQKIIKNGLEKWYSHFKVVILFNPVCNKESISEYSVQMGKKVFHFFFEKKSVETQNFSLSWYLVTYIPSRGHIHCLRLINKVLLNSELLTKCENSKYFLCNEWKCERVWCIYSHIWPLKIPFRGYYMGIKRVIIIIIF